MSTLRELAEQLGVSAATVSRALNDKPGVSKHMRQRILQLAEELQYHPNPAARSLSTSRTHNVLFVVHRRQFPTAEDPFYPYIMQGLQETLAGEGYSVMLVTLDDTQLAAGPNALRVLQENRADAVVLAGPDISSSFILTAVTSGRPVLLVDNALRETPLPAVLADNKGGCWAATSHLLNSHGHQRVALLRGPAGWVSSEERAAGYLAAIAEAGLEPHVVQATDTTIETGSAATQQALETQPEITAVVAVNDAMAIGAMRAARRMGREVPQDFAVIGFDNISWAAYADPPLTTVSAPTIEMGRLAARLLLERAEGKLTAASRTTVATRLILRDSCGCSGA